MKVCITGTTRGLGKILTEHFIKRGCTVVELNRSDDKIAPAVGCDLYINNSYADGSQIDIFNSLYNKVNKMVVMGSIASEYPDPSMLEYSYHKKELKDRVLEIANSKENKGDILLLQLTGDSYNDPELILNTIEFWLDNSKITSISFVPGNKNG